MKKSLIAFTASFAAVGYLVAVGLYVAPTRWHFSADLVYGICPPSFLTIMVDPSLPIIAFLPAPLNAVLYGIVGLMVSGLIDELIHLGNQNRKVQVRLRLHQRSVDACFASCQRGYDGARPPWREVPAGSPGESRTLFDD
jgi:hypothetical protein